MEESFQPPQPALVSLQSALVKEQQEFQLWPSNLNKRLSVLKNARCQRVEFFTAGLAEVTQGVQCAARRHCAQLWQGLVRQEIGIDYHSNDLVCSFRDARGGDDLHFVHQSIKAYNRWNCDLIVHKRIHIYIRRIFNELLVELLPSRLLL